MPKCLNVVLDLEGWLMADLGIHSTSAVVEDRS